MSIELMITSTCLSRSHRARLLERQVVDLPALPALIWNGSTVVSRRAQRTGDRLHLRDDRRCGRRLRDAFQQDHVGGIAQIVVGFDHQQFRVQPRLGEVPFGGRVTDVAGALAGRYGPVS